MGKAVRASRSVLLCALALFLCASLCAADTPGLSNYIVLKFPVAMQEGARAGLGVRVRSDLSTGMPMRAEGQFLVADGSVYPEEGRRLIVSDATGFLGAGYSVSGGMRIPLERAPSGELLVLQCGGLPLDIRQLAAGDRHVLALLSDGRLMAWGENAYGQLGDGTYENRCSPVQVQGLPGVVVAVAARGKQSLAMLADGRVFQWGGQTARQKAPGEVPGIGDAVALAAGQGHALALLSNGHILAWGDNAYGQLGDGTTTSRAQPVEVAGVTDAVAVAAGDLHSLAVLSDGTVRAWGRNCWGQLGDGTRTDRKLPVQVAGLAGVRAVAGGGAHSLAVLSDGRLYSWGYNQRGELGIGTAGASDSECQYRSSPVRVLGIANAVGASAGAEHSLAVLADGVVLAWGWNMYGQLGDGSFVDRPSPVGISGLQGVRVAAASEWTSYFLLGDGRVLACGSNVLGMMGQGAPEYRVAPVYVPGVERARQVAASSDHSLVLLTDGHVLACGSNSAGQIGDGAQVRLRPRLVPVAGLSGVVAVAVSSSTGSAHSVALLGDGRVLTWGGGAFGQLGATSSVTRSETPVPVWGITSAVAVASGNMHNLALLSDGRVMAWGHNAYGQLGDGTTQNRFAPVEVAGVSGAVAIGTSENASYALLADGRVLAWGKNDEGQLGDGSTQNRSTPAEVGGLPAIQRLWAGGGSCFAQASDGRVFAWGRNGYWQLRDGTSENRLTPVEIPSLKDAQCIHAGAYSTRALLGDGRFVAWGSNLKGQLGTGTLYDSLSLVVVQVPAAPTQVSGTTSFLAVMPDGRLMAWGDNSQGALGDPASGPQGAPVEVPGLR